MSAYLCKVCDYSKMPKPIRKIPDSFAPVLSKLKANTFFSTEFILGENQVKNKIF